MRTKHNSMQTTLSQILKEASNQKDILEMSITDFIAEVMKQSYEAGVEAGRDAAEWEAAWDKEV